MKQNAIVKWVIFGLLVFYSIFLVYEEGGFKYGIDIQGGHSFTLEIDKDELIENLKRINGEDPTEAEINAALESANKQALQVVEKRVNATGLAEAVIFPEPAKNRIVVQLPGLDAKAIDDTAKLLTKKAILHFRMVHEENASLSAALLAAGKAPEGYRIADNGLYLPIEGYDFGGQTEDQIADKLRRFERPSGGYEFYLDPEVAENGKKYYRPLFVESRIQLTGADLKSSRADPDENFQGWSVGLTFLPEPGEKFYKLSKKYSPQIKGGDYPKERGRRFAIILDDQVQSAPSLNTPIPNGTASITGNFTSKEAQELSLVLRTGSLPAKLTIQSQSSVDPSLGRESLNKSFRALILGISIVVIFMFGYYFIAGGVVNLALVADALLLPLGMMMAAGFLSLFADAGASGAGGSMLPTLTLPGIAGIILTIGMAVDANVLIFERIREEQAEGKRFVSAVRAGYDKVFSTIFDANVTTLIVAVILFMKGSGAIRGFAVTLTAGIIVSMYTALVFTRMLFDLLGRTDIKQLKMLQLIKGANINFVGKRKFAAVLSVAMILVTGFLFFQRGDKNFNVELTGGTSILIGYNEDTRPAEQAISQALEEWKVEGATFQFQTSMVDKAHLLRVQVPAEVGDTVEENLIEKFGESHGFKVLGSETVGSQIGGEMRSRGISAIIFALIGIVIYITFRFEFGFAAGAIVALLHDILITVGIFTLLGNQLSLPIIAALLTIVGYSVNDTIVVFDRIREDLELLKGRRYVDVANLSINKTLSRTMLTSLTTLLTVVMLLVFGGESINDFAVALLIGILVGTYSSIFVATPVMLLWHREEKANA